jgi:alkylhydroperoxidase family enzyme
MTSFTVHTLESAPRASVPVLLHSVKSWGVIPSLHGILAEAPLALEAYTSMYKAITTQGSLTLQEQQVAFQTVNVFHSCEYCTAGHTYLSRAVQVPEEVIAALRQGRRIGSHPRYEALRRFIEAVVHERGQAGDAEVDAFIAAGFTHAQVLEVVTIVACKTISNYTNHLARTPHEEFMSDPELKWTGPA